MKRTVSLILAAAALLATARPARAHADLVSASPAPNAALEASPVLIELFFSEPVDGTFTLIRVIDTAGKTVDNADTTVDPGNPTRATVTVRSLADGIYTVSWKALSSVDSHITTGSYPFAVGDVDAAALEAAAAAQQVSLSVGEVAFRWLTYLPAAAIAGGLLFRRFVWDPVVGPDEIDDPGKVFRTIQVAALAVLGAANVFGLLAQTGQVAGQPFAAPWNPAITRLLFDTRFGILWLIRMLCWLMLAALAGRSAERDARARLLIDLLTLAAVLGVMATFSLNSHAAAEPRPWLPVLADLFHLAAASAWFGGLVSFAGGLYTLRRRDPAQRAALAAALIPRFSNLAIVSVALMGLTGVYSAVLRVGSFAALTGTLYGRVLIVKTLLALPALLIGGLNLTVTAPSMRSEAKGGGRTGLVDRFRLLVSTEISFLAAALLVVGVFTAIPPAQAAATISTLENEAVAGDLAIALAIEPGKVGLNTFSVLVRENGIPLPGLREVALQFIPANADLAPSEAVLEDRGEGVYAIDGAYFSLPDRWQVQVSIRREGEFDTFANFEFPVGTGAGAGLDWNRYAAFLLLPTAVLAAAALKGLVPGLTPQRPWHLLPGLGLIVVALFVFRLPSGAEPRFINPIPPNRASILEGQAIYRVQCVPCHGPNGRGDGPVGLTLQPPPADLYLHTAPGVHPDGRLFEWISFGFGESSVMPRFEDILTEEERWHVVNYIRTFSRSPEEVAP